MSRDDTLQRLRERPEVSVLVIGGGINGISVFRELALNGVEVVLAEKSDFCSGASSALSRMVHGGLRYLENGEFKLVRESLLERDRLLKNAPHYVAPLPTTVPIFDIISGLGNSAFRFLRLTRRPGRRGVLVIKAGLALYDLLTGGRRALPGHQFHSRKATLQRWPGINPAVRASATYFDASVSRPERLGLEMLKDSVGGSAVALNYAEIGRDAGGLVVRDKIGHAEIAIRPKLIVNATGGWIDLTNAATGHHTKPLLGGTKGSHLIVDHAPLYDALAGNMIYYENEDGRICILFPYLGKVLVGSTDIRVDDPDTVHCDSEEREYLLQSLAVVFPSLRIKPEEIVFQFSGVRPLPASEDSVTGRIPRDHFCEVIEGSVPSLCMIGGKWTTFRSFGALAADMVLGRLGKPRTHGTEDDAIGGGRAYPADKGAWIRHWAGATGLPEARLQTLLERYGTEAEPIARFICAEDDRPIAGTDHSRRELLYLARNEYVETIADVVLRRTDIGITGRLSMAAIEEVLDLLSAERGWTVSARATARTAFLDELARKHGLDEATLISRDHRIFA